MSDKTPMSNLKIAITVCCLFGFIMLVLAFTVFNHPIQKANASYPVINPTAIADKVVVDTPKPTLNIDDILRQHLDNVNNPVVTDTPIPTVLPTIEPTVTPVPIPQQVLTPLKDGDFNKLHDTDIPTLDYGDLAVDINSPNTYLGNNYYYIGDKAVFKFDLFSKADYTITDLKYYVTVRDGQYGIVLYPRTLLRDSTVNIVTQTHYKDFASFDIPAYRGFYEVTVDCVCNGNKGFTMVSKFNIL